MRPNCQRLPRTSGTRSWPTFGRCTRADLAEKRPPNKIPTERSAARSAGEAGRVSGTQHVNNGPATRPRKRNQILSWITDTAGHPFKDCYKASGPSRCHQSARSGSPWAKRSQGKQTRCGNHSTSRIRKSIGRYPVAIRSRPAPGRLKSFWLLVSKVHNGTHQPHQHSSPRGPRKPPRWLRPEPGNGQGP